MSTPGQLSYQHFVLQLSEKASSRYITNRDVQNIGSCFWSLLGKDFKDQCKEAGDKKPFWSFSIFLKKCLIDRNVEEIFDLWESFDINGQNMWEHMYDNCIKKHVDAVL
jgi:hypothetical protein